MPVSSADMAAAGSEDVEIKALISQIPQRWPFTVKEVPAALKPYFKYRHQLSIEKARCKEVRGFCSFFPRETCDCSRPREPSRHRTHQTAAAFRLLVAEDGQRSGGDRQKLRG